MEEALVGGERGVVEAPVGEIVSGGVTIPLGWGKVEGDLHPVALGLVVAVHWGRRLAGVGAEGHQDADQGGEEEDQGCCRWG